MSKDSWSIFKIMSEFVEGFEALHRIGPCVSIFGSARTQENNDYYNLAEEIAFQLTRKGYGVITGGGPGIMEAGNKGAQKGSGKSVGLNIELPFEQTSNPYIDADKLIDFDSICIWDLVPKKKRTDYPYIARILVDKTNIFDGVDCVLIERQMQARMKMIACALRCFFWEKSHMVAPLSVRKYFKINRGSVSTPGGFPQNT